MQRRLLLSAAVAAPVVLSGCASQNLDGYASEKPVLDLAQYFNADMPPLYYAMSSAETMPGFPEDWQ